MSWRRRIQVGRWKKLPRDCEALQGVLEGDQSAQRTGQKHSHLGLRKESSQDPRQGGVTGRVAGPSA